MDIVIILDNIRSAENVGNILRTAEFLGIKKIYALGITPLPPHSKVLKSSLGAEQNLYLERRFKTKPLINELKRKKFKIIAIEQTKKSIPFFKFKYKFPKIALIVGNELGGINKNILKLSDYILEIPKLGKIKNSLNVSNALAIILSYIIFNHSNL
ncbi:MAG: rRNA methyltransferase [Candidatus Parcubacteria bacterium]|nr:MAG: rRNA methyltransferase [Candidatus Parcubacteria bacterium]